MTTVETRIPAALFTTQDYRPQDRFEVWRDSASALYEVLPPEGSAHPGFQAAMAAFHLGDLILIRSQYEAQRFERSARRAARDGIDHYQIDLYLTGGVVGTAGARDRHVEAGDVQILDLGRPIATAARASDTVALYVPRDLLDAALPIRGDLHGLVLSGRDGAGALLGDYLKSLARRAPTLTTEAALHVAPASVALIAACLRPSAEHLARAAPLVGAVTLDRVKQHIETRLDDETLGPDALCSTFGLSRSGLYRLFETLGGVAAYVQERRLARAWRALAYRPSGQRIIDIALDCGFASEAHFSRQFRRAYGMSPSEARGRFGQAAAAEPAEGASDAVIGVWIAGLRQA